VIVVGVVKGKGKINGNITTKIFAPQTPQKWGVFSHFLKIYGENLGVL
jgi:phosphoribosylaminoimidazole-succinocarboxamide synthase